MKKILVKIAWTMVLQILIEVARQQAVLAKTQEWHERWNMIISFLELQRDKGPV